LIECWKNNLSVIEYEFGVTLNKSYPLLKFWRQLRFIEEKYKQEKKEADKLKRAKR